MGVPGPRGHDTGEQRAQVLTAGKLSQLQLGCHTPTGPAVSELRTTFIPQTHAWAGRGDRAPWSLGYNPDTCKLYTYEGNLPCSPWPRRLRPEAVRGGTTGVLCSWRLGIRAATDGFGAAPATKLMAGLGHHDPTPAAVPWPSHLCTEDMRLPVTPLTFNTINCGHSTGALSLPQPCEVGQYS